GVYVGFGKECPHLQRVFALVGAYIEYDWRSSSFGGRQNDLVQYPILTARFNASASAIVHAKQGQVVNPSPEALESRVLQSLTEKYSSERSHHEAFRDRFGSYFILRYS